MTSRLRPRRRTLIEWGAAALVAAALFALPVLVLGALEDRGAGWLAGVAVAVVVLVVHAWRTSSLLVVLGALIGAGLATVAFYAIIILADTCGGTAAGIVEWSGAVVIALGLGAWGVLHGLRVLWATPLALVCAAAWIALVAQLVPGGAGSCVN